MRNLVTRMRKGLLVTIPTKIYLLFFWTVVANPTRT